MGIFRQFPYTNFHDLNLDWLIGRIKELWQGVEDIDEKVDNFIADTEPTIRDEVDKWLDEHPEATTTVQDHSLTEIKFADELAYKTIKDYVTPQMFGAVGDGITDDTQAFKDAIASGKKVLVPAGDYMLTETIISDDSIIFSDAGSYPQNKVVISKEILSSGVSPAYQDGVYLSPLGLKGIQGCVWNSKNNTMIMSSNNSNAGTNIPALIEVDWENKTLLKTLTGTRLGHANDITYNPHTNKIYVATLEGNRIEVIDADLFTYNNPIEVDNLAGIFQISYDPDARIYYIGSYEGMYIYDENFEQIKKIHDGHITVDFTNNPTYPHIQAWASQGSCVFNGQFFGLIWIWAEPGFTTYARLIQYDNVNGGIKAMYDFPTLGSDDEPEALVNMGDHILLMGYWGEALNQIKIIPDARLSNSAGAVRYFVQGTNGTHIGILNIQIQGNEQIAFCRIKIRLLQDLTQGNSYYATLSNLSMKQGMVQGFYSEVPFMGEIVNGTIAVRPFKNLPAGAEVNMTGFIVSARMS